jgi:hypothetical protein
MMANWLLPFFIQIHVIQPLRRLCLVAEKKKKKKKKGEREKEKERLLVRLNSIINQLVISINIHASPSFPKLFADCRNCEISRDNMTFPFLFFFFH